jgi:hypothetical protein
MLDGDEDLFPFWKLSPEAAGRAPTASRGRPMSAPHETHGGARPGAGEKRRRSLIAGKRDGEKEA